MSADERRAEFLRRFPTVTFTWIPAHPATVKASWQDGQVSPTSAQWFEASSLEQVMDLLEAAESHGYKFGAPVPAGVP